MQRAANRLWVRLAVVVTLFGCGAIQRGQERYYIKEARNILAVAVPESVRRDCGYRTDLSDPIFIPFDRSDPKARVGAYWAGSRQIAYDKENPQIIIHEAQHDLNANGQYGAVSRECLDQVSAYYALEIYRLRTELWRAKRARLN